MLLVCVRGSSRVHGGVPCSGGGGWCWTAWWWCGGCAGCVWYPGVWWVWWQGLVVVEYVMVWCGDVRYVGRVVRGAWLCWGVVGK